MPDGQRASAVPAAATGLGHPAITAALRCPLDDRSLTLEDRTLRCSEGHAFDLARQGYVNLAVGRDPGTGDGADMVAARDEVFATGRFDRLGAALADRVLALVGPVDDREDAVVVDLGAGTGDHLAGVVARADHLVGIAVDLSKPALRRAARRHPRVGAVLADVWGPLPLGSGTATAVTCVFSPRNGPEIARILRPDGALVVATPTPAHLAELLEPLGMLTVEPNKDERLVAALAADLGPAGRDDLVEGRWTLDHGEVRAVVAMGPSADHVAADVLASRTGELPERVEVTSSVRLRTFRPRRGGSGHD